MNTTAKRPTGSEAQRIQSEAPSGDRFAKGLRRGKAGKKHDACDVNQGMQ